MGKILVTGGCGYIGSHTIVELVEHGFEVISVDNLSNSDEQVLTGIEKTTGIYVQNYAIDVNDRVGLDELFSKEDIEGVIHFAALKSVNESVNEPMLYYRNNVSGLINLIDVMQKHDCHRLIFSSSCSVYGNSKEVPVTEDTPLAEPESPYARTKLMGEQILRDMSGGQSGISTIALRYFNPAGAHPGNEIGESPTQNASNLVPVVTETAMGLRKEMTVFGEDYPTRDGTCIRDYIHVTDIAQAHVHALSYILESRNKSPFEIFNLGSGIGNTVLEVINSFQSVTGQSVPHLKGPRRAGDVISIYANNDRAKSALDWKPKYSLDDIMRTAWNWEKKRRGWSNF